MIESLLVGGSALAVYLSQKFVRTWWFHRRNYTPTESALRSDRMMVPVDGTVVYVKPVKKGVVHTEKKGTVIADNWVGEEDGYLIGIYMCVYDRHFIANPINGDIRVKHETTTANIPMMDLWEYINFYYVGKFVNWFEEKAFNYKLQNEKVIYEYKNGVKLMGIADKFVNKIEIPDFVHRSWVKKGLKIGHIRRGSQVDIFIPYQLAGEIYVKPNDKVKVGEELCQIYLNHSEF